MSENNLRMFLMSDSERSASKKFLIGTAIVFGVGFAGGIIAPSKPELGDGEITYKKTWHPSQTIKLDEATTAKFTELAKNVASADSAKTATEALLKKELASYVDSTEKAQAR